MPCVGGTTPEQQSSPVPIRWAWHHPFTLTALLIALAVGYLAMSELVLAVGYLAVSWFLAEFRAGTQQFLGQRTNREYH